LRCQVFLGIVSQHFHLRTPMPRIPRFSFVSPRDFFLTVAFPALLIVALAWIAYKIIDPFPPSSVVLSTGQENSAYEEYAKRYAAKLERHGIKVVLRRSLGSQENLRRLIDESSDVDIAFVQSGAVRVSEVETDGLMSLGSVFVEPVWLFYRRSKDISEFGQLKGLKINVGPEDTGVPALFTKLLEANGMQPQDIVPGSLENTPATVELLEGRIDGLVFVSAPDSLLVQMLLQTPGIRLFDFTQAEAYSRRFPFLSHMVLPRGIVDLGRNLPEKDFHLIAPTATLVARTGLHPALEELFVQAAAEVHGGAGWFHKQGEFPNARQTDFPVAEDAQKYYASGQPLLQRYLPFWIANFFERMWVVIVALGALIIPLSRIVPPLYVWKVRSRIYRWYGQLREVERRLDDADEAGRAEVGRAQLQRLDEIESRVNGISIPLSFAEELYGLRSHIHLVRKRIGEWMKRG
jgi:hypothetical protein